MLDFNHRCSPPKMGEREIRRSESFPQRSLFYGERDRVRGVRSAAKPDRL
jgi:hypothetical protein